MVNAVKNGDLALLRYAFRYSNGTALSYVQDAFDALPSPESGNILYVLTVDANERSYLGWDTRPEARLLGAIVERGDREELVSFIRDKENPPKLVKMAERRLARWDSPGYEKNVGRLPPARSPPDGYQNHPDAKVIFEYLMYLRDIGAPELKKRVPARDDLRLIKGWVAEKRAPRVNDAGARPIGR